MDRLARYHLIHRGASNGQRAASCCVLNNGVAAVPIGSDTFLVISCKNQGISVPSIDKTNN